MRLISFLGTGDADRKYKPTTYVLGDVTVSTNYIAYALTAMFQPQEVWFIATDEAWSSHGDALTTLLTHANFPNPNRVPVPTGGQDQQLWQMFGAIVDVIRTSRSPVLLDITHGFRMQPFFAAACIQYVQSVLPSPPDIRVVYGEFRGPERESPIWELTPFLELLSWSRNLMMFLRTGHQADEVAKETDNLGRALNKERAGMEGLGYSQLQKLAKAIKSFSADFTTIRTGSLLIGKETDPASAKRLLDAIEQTSEEVAEHLPALALVLDQVRVMVEPLRTGEANLSSTEGQRVLLALARLYQKMGRYSEAISVLREGWITLGAPQGADKPGPGFDRQRREAQEQTWQNSTTQSRSVSELRNDIQHAGFNQQPKDRIWFEKQLTTLLDQWQEAIDSIP